jgi:hypothetical protein
VAKLNRTQLNRLRFVIRLRQKRRRRTQEEPWHKHETDIDSALCCYLDSINNRNVDVKTFGRVTSPASRIPSQSTKPSPSNFRWNIQSSSFRCRRHHNQRFIHESPRPCGRMFVEIVNSNWTHMIDEGVVLNLSWALSQRSSVFDRCSI